VEHFVTLFDQAFLAMGLALHRSLQAQVGTGKFRLWIICMDEEVERSLAQLQLADVSLIPLREVETEALLAVKPGRSRGEYCWTMTPFAPSAVMDRAPDAQRVTYLDADLYFFAAPQILFDEFERSGKHVLITDHAYAPEYDVAATSGRFCVQFMTFRRTAPSMEVLRSWQEQCVEWCFARYEPGRFGDQKYLDEWPQKFGDAVHILQQTDKTLAPWNAAYFAARGPLKPVFYHFQGFRLVKGRTVVCSIAYKITAPVRVLYETYIKALGGEVDGLEQRGIRVVRLPRPTGLRQMLRDLRDSLRGVFYWSQI
jgi:hypothetical protein